MLTGVPATGVFDLSSTSESILIPSLVKVNDFHNQSAYHSTCLRMTKLIKIFSTSGTKTYY